MQLLQGARVALWPGNEETPALLLAEAPGTGPQCGAAGAPCAPWSHKTA